MEVFITVEIEYRRDINNNYMVIRGCDGLRDKGYWIKMLSCQPIEGILAIERRVIDNQTYYYYDITSKQSMSNILSKATLSCSQVKQLLYSIIATIEEAYDYLLSEDDFVLKADLIYMDINFSKAYLCYYSGYGKHIKDQMADLIEFIMNKVDYRDKEAVYLVYSMYSASKQDTFAFCHLKEALINIKNDMNEFKQSIEISHDDASNNRLDQKPHKSHNELYQDSNPPKNEKHKCMETAKQNLQEKMKLSIPIMMEKVVSDEELLCYPYKTYVYTGLVILTGIIILLFCIKGRLIHNSIGTKIDYTKLLLLILLLASLETYLLRIIWKNDNKITKIIPKSEYIDPREDEEDINSDIIADSISIDFINQTEDKLDNYYTEKSKFSVKNDYEYQDINKGADNINNIASNGKEIYSEEDYNPTILLNESSISTSSFATIYRLKSVDDSTYEDIIIKEFPLFIGKLKKNVDYCLDNEAVSRYHAKITVEDGIFYLYDLNSKNGTYLNGVRLNIYERQILNIGDLVSFANIKYYFDKM